MSDNKRIPPERTWVDRSFNGDDMRHVIEYIQSLAGDFFGSGKKLTTTMLSYDAQGTSFSLKADFPVDPHAFGAFVRKMQHVFNRPASAYSNDAPQGITYVVPAEPGTPQAANSFTLKGNPRQLLEQIIVNSNDLDQLATDFPWNAIGGNKGRSL